MWISWIQTKRSIWNSLCGCLHVVCVKRSLVLLMCMYVDCPECLFSPFAIPPTPLLFAVSSLTVSLPTRPVSLDLSHEEATFWLCGVCRKIPTWTQQTLKLCKIQFLAERWQIQTPVLGGWGASVHSADIANLGLLQMLQNGSVTSWKT